ncbi:MAG: hypothetical protein ACRD2B_13680 [Terriglobia bacterium]
MRLTFPRPNDSADMDYYRGMALARLKRWKEAERAFERGRRKAPRDPRFPIELAGIAFTQKRYSEAKRDLRHALHLDPHNAYVLNFLATIYDLENNLGAALKYWNREGMPEIQKINISPQPRVDPVLLNHAFAFSPGDILTFPDLLTTQARLRWLGIFVQPRLGLQPLNDGRFDAQFAPDERNGWGDSKLQGLLSLLRGAPYDTVYPEFFNIRQSAMNFTSLLRWDPNKERVFASFSSPLAGSAERRYDIYLDGRRENWNLTKTFFGSSSPPSDMHMEKIEGGAKIQTIVGGRFEWSTGVDFSGRSFGNFGPINSQARPFFRNGFAMESRSSFDAQILNLPEKRLTLQSGASAQVGKLAARNSNPFLQAETSFLARWFPQAQGDDYAMTFEAKAGKTWGTPPFDDLFILGIERDNNLWLRAHVGTFDGRKGSAPLGRNYVLFNWDDFKSIYRNGLVNLGAGPFLDSGTISDASGDFGSRGWLVDTGVELKLEVLGGATVELFFGKDLRTGANAFYATTASYGYAQPGVN